MNNADRQWITEYGPIYGPYRCYSKWTVRAWTALALAIVVGCLIVMGGVG